MLHDGRVAIVTGAGRGIGREEALSLAREGARLVVNDLGGARDGSGTDAGPAQQVVDEIAALGGEAVASTHDVSDFEAAGEMVRLALDTFGRLDVLVNNAGILRDRMFVNMTPDEWDAIMTVHLRGTFAPTRHAMDVWRAASKAGEAVAARVVNTTSASGIYGNVGQTNYGAAKAGIAAFTVILAKEVERYGVLVNAIAPGALTRLTEDLLPERPPLQEGYDPRSPAEIAPLVTWLASPQCEITGRVVDVRGGRISVTEGWALGPVATTDAPWTVEQMGEVLPDLARRAAPNATMTGERPAP